MAVEVVCVVNGIRVLLRYEGHAVSVETKDSKHNPAVRTLRF